jgi:hypothetical protein
LLLAHAGVVAGTQAIVKNVQRGSTDMGVNPRDVTITAVDTTKAYVIGSSRTNTSDPRCRVTFELINATTVRITSNLVNAATEVEWEVVEFASDVVIKRNVTTFNALTQNVALAPAVVVNKSFVLISERYGSSNTNQDERWTIRARLTAGNNLELARNETGTDQHHVTARHRQHYRREHIRRRSRPSSGPDTVLPPTDPPRQRGDERRGGRIHGLGPVPERDDAPFHARLSKQLRGRCLDGGDAGA